ncbi:DoxX family protein [Nonomuraea sp. NPDC049309]|uniref:DoxX family protein n=1 Tax=Nonomuraea sp. NPDC049309 TaxID=3364350 RepID=UPI003724C37D
MAMASQSRTTGGRVAHVALWVLQVVLAGFFVMSALGKFTGAEPAKSTFEAIGWGDWFRHLTGVLEAAGAVGLVVPPLAGLAGLAFVALTACAALAEWLVNGGSGVLPLCVLVLCAVVAWGRRESTRRLWSRLTGR